MWLRLGDAESQVRNLKGNQWPLFDVFFELIGGFKDLFLKLFHLIFGIEIDLFLWRQVRHQSVKMFDMWISPFLFGLPSSKNTGPCDFFQGLATEYCDLCQVSGELVGETHWCPLRFVLHLRFWTSANCLGLQGLSGSWTSTCRTYGFSMCLPGPLST